MKRLFLSILLLSLSIPLIISSHVSATSRGIRVATEQGKSVYLYKDYYAVVVGVGNYEKWPRLPNAVKDVEEVAVKLKDLGFTVKLVLDPVSREMKTIINEMVYGMGREENRAILFYYAGHGETETLADGTKMGYLIPRDCPRLDKDPLGFATHAISMRDIESVSLRIKAKHVLMLFDSCFSGSLFALVRAVPHDITEKSALPVRQYITAGREDEQVPDKSMFKRCLLIGLEGDADLTGDGYITGSELGMYLSDKVVNYTHRRQHPQYGKINNPDLDRGDFIFASLPSLKAKLRAAQEKLQQGSEEQGTREDELQSLRAEIEELSRTLKELKGKQTEEERVASIPKEVERPIIPKLRLRDTPKELWPSDVKEMIQEHNFFAKYLNENGDFPNDLVDNGDGTITDRATALIWEKGGSPSLLYYWQAEKYISRLNRQKFLGHTGWRIPTLEELASLLEPGANERGQYKSPIFNAKQYKCWSADPFGGHRISGMAELKRIVDFSKGGISHAVDSSTIRGANPSRCYVRAVRSIE
jgi:hypothetical protein